MAERGGPRAGRCTHTVADWARYVRAPREGAPLFAACRLLVKEGEPADDPRTIACGFWGRQPDCPLYEGPARLPAAPVAAAPAEPVPEQRLTADQIRRARLLAEDYARRGPLTDPMRQRRRATAAALAFLVLMVALAAWLAH